MTNANATQGSLKMTTAVFLDYDQSALDRQLNLRARWPEHATYFDRWARDSGVVLNSKAVERDLAYGDDAQETLDLFPLPGDGPPNPLLMFIHGGYWQSLDKTDFAYLAPPFLDSGVAFASINYGLAPMVGIEHMVHQCRSAVLKLHREAAKYNIDPERIFLCGHSAGGHLAAMTMLTPWAQLETTVSSPLQGGCAISGLYELTPIRLSYHNDILGLDAKTADSMSPITCLHNPDRPFLCAAGSEETDEFLRQQRAFVQKAGACGWALGEMECAGLNHFSIVQALADPEHPLFQAVRGLVDGSDP